MPTTDSATTTHACFFCGQRDPNHRHYTVLCYDQDQCLGRLGPGGYLVRRRIRALALGKRHAEQIAAEINAEGSLTARVKLF